MKKMLFNNKISGSEKSFWLKNWETESVEKQIQALKWSGYIPVFEKYIKNKGIIFDNGCGLGSSIFFFEKNNIIGLDYIFKPLSILKRYKNDLKLINGDGFHLPIKNRTFDYCLSLGVVEHFEKEGSKPLILECNRILKKDGILIISVPYYNLIERIRLLFQNKNGQFFQYLFTKKEIKKIINQCNFEVIECYYCNKLGFFYNIYKKFFKISNQVDNITETLNKENSNRQNKYDKIQQLNRIIPFFLTSVMILIVAKKL